METWKTSSNMKITHTHRHCPCLENFGLGQNLTSSSVWKICAHHVETGEAPVADVIKLDGAAIINMLKAIDVKTFQDYATHVFLPSIKAQLRNVTRIDIIWDVYLEVSLSSTAKEIRGRGIRRHVAPSYTIPGNWHEFLRLAISK